MSHAPSHDEDPQNAFAALPGWNSRPGETRKVGVEIEFGGLDEGRAAELAQQHLGGEMQHDGTKIVLRGSALGTIEVYLDTSLREKLAEAFGETGLSLGRTVIPVELVTQPLRQTDLPALEALFRILARAGAVGTQRGFLLGFGLHLNVEIADPDGGDVAAVGTAFAFLERWIRDRRPIDISRRLLPFTDRYPAAFLDALADAPGTLSAEAFRDCYFAFNATRNRGLDLLPALRHLYPDDFDRRFGAEAEKVAARPAYHYRLPDSRLGDPHWSLAAEWDDWMIVERAARDEALLTALRGAWARRGWYENRTFGTWSEIVDGLLTQARLHPEAA